MCQKQPWRRVGHLVFIAVLWGIAPWIVRAIHSSAASDPVEGGANAFEDLPNFHDALHWFTTPLHSALQNSPAFYAIWAAVVYAQLALLSVWAARSFYRFEAPSLAWQVAALLSVGAISNLLANLPPSRDRIQPEPVGVQLWFGIAVQHVDSYVAPRLAWLLVLLRYVPANLSWQWRWALGGHVLLFVTATRLLFTTGLLNTACLAALLVYMERRWSAEGFAHMPTNDERRAAHARTFEIEIETGISDRDDEDDTTRDEGDGYPEPVASSVHQVTPRAPVPAAPPTEAATV